MNQKMITGSGGCFRKGALVQLEGGKTKPIEELKLGDEVLSFDEWGYVTKSVVTETHFHPEPEPLINVKFWQGETTITPNHWVLNAIKTFSAMGDLGIGEALVDGFGNLRPIIAIKKVDPEPVYNLTVEPYHTFICDGVRVHNGGYRASYPTIGGSGGGGKKKKKNKGMQEDPDSLQSTSIISVLDLIGEGEIGGLVYKGETINVTFTDDDGQTKQETRDKSAMSIFLDDTPLMASDGTYNFDSVGYDSVEGTQNQEIIEGFGDIEESVSVGEEVTKKGGGIVKTITNPNADKIRVVVSVSALTRTDNKTGDIHGSSVSYMFECRHNTDNWTTLGTHTITGKTRSTYQRAHEYPLPKNAALGANENHVWNIRMKRITDDSESSLIADTLNWDSYSIIVESRLNYPNTALVGVTIDAETFSSVPSRSYLVNGLKIKVPKGYKPPYRDTVAITDASIAGWHKATYPTVWDGSFETRVCSNPAWILYDLLTEQRYGLGQFIDPEDIDVGKLYKIGKYCDELIESGYTTDKGQPYLEPRFQINTVIQQRTDAYKVISDICSAFRGMAFWAGGEIGIMADMPTLPTMKYTPANVIDGMFTYQGSARKDRHSVALVTWNNPDQYYQQEVEYVEDPDLVDKYGVRETEIVDFGCTSRGQARRAGLWLLYTEKHESDIISFDVGIDSSLVLPGEVVEIHDTVRAGKRFGGRIKNISQYSAELDSPIEVGLNDGDIIFSIRMKDGTFAERLLRDKVNKQEGLAIGEHTSVYWNDALPKNNLPLMNAIWLASSENLEPLTARVVAIRQKTSSTFTISVLEHNPSKYDAIEKGLILDEPKISILNFSRAEEVSNLTILEVPYETPSGTTGLKMMVSWTGNSPSYVISYRRLASRSLETLTTEVYTVSLQPATTTSGSIVTTTTVDVAEVDTLNGFAVTTTTSTTRSDTGETTSETSSASYTLGTSTDAATGATVTVTRSGNTYTVSRTLNGSTTTQDYTIGVTSSSSSVPITIKNETLVSKSGDTLTVKKTTTVTKDSDNSRISQKVDTKTYTLGDNIVRSADGLVSDRYTVYENLDPSGNGTGYYTIETRHTDRTEELPDSWTTITVTEPVYEIMNVQKGKYEIQVQSVSLNGNRSEPVTTRHEVVNIDAISTVGTPKNFVVRKRIYDLLCEWDSVVDSNVMGYEVRYVKGNGGWDSDNSVIVQSNIRASSCIDDKDEAGDYRYYLKSISVDGVYCETPAVFDLHLITPRAVSGFTCVQSGQRVEFKWDKNPEQDVVYYEIREGASWGVSTLVTESDATTYTYPTSSKVMDRTFWIKAVATPGIYSTVAMMANLTSVSLANKNVVWSHNEAWIENDWHGIHFNTEKSDANAVTTDVDYNGVTHNVTHDLRLVKGNTYGEYIHKLDLPRVYNESNYIDFDYLVINREETTWKQTTSQWKQTDRPWVISGDYGTCNIKHYISLLKGYNAESILSQDSNIIEAFPLFNDQQGKVTPLNPTTALELDTGEGRFMNGTRLDNMSVLDWTNDRTNRNGNVVNPIIQNGQEFFIHFWYHYDLPKNDATNERKNVVFQVLYTDGTILSIGFNFYYKTFYAETLREGQTVGEVLEIKDYYPDHGEKIMFGISQETNARTLFVGRVGHAPKYQREQNRTVYVDGSGVEWNDPVILDEPVQFQSGESTVYTNSFGVPLIRKDLDFGLGGRTVKKFGFILSDFLQ